MTVPKILLLEMDDNSMQKIIAMHDYFDRETKDPMEAHSAVIIHPDGKKYRYFVRPAQIYRATEH